MWILIHNLLFYLLLFTNYYIGISENCLTNDNFHDFMTTELANIVQNLEGSKGLLCPHQCCRKKLCNTFNFRHNEASVDAPLSRVIDVIRYLQMCVLFKPFIKRVFYLNNKFRRPSK